ncbi:MAG: CGNR zinc finger domain-containing protein [Chromatiales bacterium]|jgi:predicted RNA-binding Zn ribbon-like protein
MKQKDPDFVFLGNSAAVDFINTEMVSRGELVDLIKDDADLIRWTKEAGLANEPTLTTGDLSTAKTLRSALKDLYHASVDRRSAGRGSLATVNRHLANHATHEVLRPGSSRGDFELVPDNTASRVAALLANLAYEGAVLLASPQASRLKRCGNPECVLIFLDTSRSQKRRWCSMETCGNRAKVAKHYRRQTQ